MRTSYGVRFFERAYRMSTSLHALSNAPSWRLAKRFAGSVWKNA
jgi:hypothetical protein